ncbi:MAG: VOC family protein [Candidatus Omnitrophica bacterium]|nr:VOC family protein [Candidatus Omnitrophota bacterium]
MIKGIRHTGIVIDDLEKSLHFYQDLLGLKIIKQMREKSAYIDSVLALKGVEVTTIKMTAADGQMIELLKFYSHPQELIEKKICDIGPTHIAFTVDDLDRMYKELSTKGVLFSGLPCVSPDAYAKVVFCQAPEGTFIELVEVL